MATYEKVIENELTGETVLIKANDLVTFENRLFKKLTQWEKQNKKIKSKKQAEKLTKEALQAIEEHKSILKFTIDVDDKIDWEKIRKEPKAKIALPQKPNKAEYFEGVDVFGDLHKIPFVKDIGFIRDKKREREEQANTMYSKALEEYEEELAEVEEEKKKIDVEYDDLKKSYEALEPNGVEKYFDLVLERSNYPDNFNLSYTLHYSVNEKLAIVDVVLPPKSDYPSIIEYKYIQSRELVEPKKMKPKDFETFFSDVNFQVLLRTIHEVLESDYQEAVELVVCNLKVERNNKKTGKLEGIYVASLQTTKSEFEEINLDAVDPYECFKHLKGVTAGSLVELSPVRPIMQVNTDDKRIIAADSIIDHFDETSNLATMDWQDFEVLVRDLIAKEFAGEGAKVEVTQASRDEGVDALAFDEDPIRGGKFVIQAKRYNNVVPLSAVRDLYGTVVNEGAVKGILITTSYYGKDSLQFAKDKPLKLINGEEMLYMFNKHGYKFKIELVSKRKQKSKKALSVKSSGVPS